MSMGARCTQVNDECSTPGTLPSQAVHSAPCKEQDASCGAGALARAPPTRNPRPRRAGASPCWSARWTKRATAARWPPACASCRKFSSGFTSRVRRPGWAGPWEGAAGPLLPPSTRAALAAAGRAQSRSAGVGGSCQPDPYRGGLVLPGTTRACLPPAPIAAAADHGAADVRPLLRAARQGILAGVVVLFSRVMPLDCADPSAHPLWQLATKARGRGGGHPRALALPWAGEGVQELQAALNGTPSWCLPSPLPGPHEALPSPAVDPCRSWVPSVCAKRRSA